MLRSWHRLGGRATIVGGGPVGAATAVVLRRHGFEVDIFERYPDLRQKQLNARRSINLVLARRGLRLAESLGVCKSLLEQSVPVYGRQIHSADGKKSYQPYGHDNECNYAVARGYLNSFWLNEAEKSGARLHFNRMLQNFDLNEGTATFTSTAGPEAGVDRRNDVIIKEDESGLTERMEGIDLFIGCDGAGSKCRQLMLKEKPLNMQSNFVNWGYKEVTFPVAGSTGLSVDDLHIWPRGDHFLMALANPDGSFTGTIYVDGELPFPDGTKPTVSGDGPTFQNTTSSENAARDFWKNHYPDVYERLGEGLVKEYLENSAGILGSVRLDEYHLSGKRTTGLLAGDACHAIVPFFGQGVQCGFEDAFVLGEILSEGRSMDDTAKEYSRQRVRSCHALRKLALDNMAEMGDRVGQEKFRFLKQLESKIERELASKYRSRYALVCYSYNDYADVLEVGDLQHSLLEELAEGVSSPEELSMAKAEALIDEKLTPEFARRGMTLDLGGPAPHLRL
jgi:kynurenine 3-monooxygenase